MSLRDSGIGFLLYYATSVALITASIYAASENSILSYIAAFFCFLALVGQDFFWLRTRKLAPSDQALAKRIGEAIRESKTVELLRHCDFAHHGVSDYDMEQLREINNEWVGVDFEFYDKACQKIWFELKQTLDELIKLINANKEYKNTVNFLLTSTEAGEQANALAKQILNQSEAIRKIHILRMQ